MNFSRTLSVFVVVAIATLSGCASFSKDATFLFTGSVTDSAGAPAVLSVNDGIDLCADVTYNELSQGKFVASHTVKVCERLVTNQTAQFSVMSLNKLAMNEDSDTAEIKNLKVYARKSVSNGQSTTYYLMPARISDIAIREDGATVKSDVVVMDI